MQVEFLGCGYQDYLSGSAIKINELITLGYIM